jgi:hypothetical protein
LRVGWRHNWYQLIYLEIKSGLAGWIETFYNKKTTNQSYLVKLNIFYSSVLFAVLVAPVRILAANVLNPWVPDGEFWGSETNGVKAGFYVQHTTTNHFEIRIIPLLKFTGTNTDSVETDRLHLWLPPSNTCYQMVLLDDKSHPVAKTTKGKSLGSPISQPARFKAGINLAAGWGNLTLYRNAEPWLSSWGEPYDKSLKLLDYFSVTDPGKYHLKLELRVVWINKRLKDNPRMLLTTNLPLASLPPVEAEIEIKPDSIIK